jgi:hypothetical protein
LKNTFLLYLDVTAVLVNIPKGRNFCTLFSSEDGNTKQFKHFLNTYFIFLNKVFYSRISPCFECHMFFFWVVLRHVEFNSQCFGTLCLFHLHRRVVAKCGSIISNAPTLRTDSPMKMEHSVSKQWLLNSR